MEEYVSPDGRLRLIVSTGDDGDVTLGFDGFPWHTHANLLAVTTELPQAEAVRRFVADLLGGVSVVVLWSVAGELRDVWVSVDPARDAGYVSSPYAEPGESVALRYWDGQPWRAEP